MSKDALRELVDKQAIRDVLSRYCRGLDRMDKAMARAVWHSGGTALYEGIFEGTGHGFIDWVWEAHAGMERHSHQITNVLIESNPGDADKATSEAYVTVVLWTLPDADGRQQELVGRGRSLGADRWSLGHRTPYPCARYVEQLPSRPRRHLGIQRPGRDGSFFRIHSEGLKGLTYLTSVRTGNLSM